MKTIKIILILLLSLFLLHSLSINIHFPKTNLLSNSFIWVILLVPTYKFLKNTFEIKEKRLIICSLSLAIILATFELLGHIIDNYLELNSTFISKIIIFKWLGYCILFYSCIILLYNYLNKLKLTINTEQPNIFTANKKTFFICFWIIFCSYIPYFLTYFPGILTPDSKNQIIQSLGLSALNNNHPILHTFIIGIFMKISTLFNNYNVGVAIYSLFQMLLMSAVFSFVIYYMEKKNIPKIFRILTLLFYAFYPVHSLYSITMWKDIPFALVFVLFIIFLTEIATNKENFFKSKKQLMCFIIICILLILLRNNGIYVFILAFPFILFINKRYYKYLLSIFIIVIGFYIIWKNAIFNIFNIQKGLIREALSIPLQQFARIYRDEFNFLTEEEKESIYKFIPVENIDKLYDPRLSDPIKFSSDNSAISENKKEFIGLWIKFSFKYPIETLEAFLCNSYGYWYPEAYNWVVSRQIELIDSEWETTLNLHEKPIIGGKIFKEIDSYIDKRNIPILSMFFSLGFTFWVVLLCFIYIIYKKNYNLIILYFPIIFLWLTNLASPVFCEFRYMYSMFTCLPMLIANIYFIKEHKNE